MSDDALLRIEKQLDVARTIPSTPLRLRERAVEQCVDHIMSNPRFDNIQVFKGNLDAMSAGLRHVRFDGAVAEFGVYEGRSITAIAKYFGKKTVHGFDSFLGLPEAWGGTVSGKGAFNIGGKPPKIPVSNVEFHVGYFDTTVPVFAEQHSGPFAFAHLDADLYSSTATVFTELESWFVPDTIVVFDEYFGYYGWDRHEHKAFMEFLDRTGLDYEALAIGHMNLVVRLVSK